MKKTKIVRDICVLIVALHLAGCASLRGGKPSENPGAGAVAGTRSEERNTSHDYILGPDDVLRIIVEQHPEWSGEFTVRPDEKISIPRVGELSVSGLSKYGVEVALANQLEQYINNPRVTVDIARYASQVIYVLGEVNRPGKYSTEGKKMSLRDAVITAGLPTRFAATRRVYIIAPSAKRPRQRVVDLDRILYRGELRRDVRLNPGDIVYVPKNIWGEIADFFSVILSPVSATVPAMTAVP